MAKTDLFRRLLRIARQHASSSGNADLAKLREARARGNGMSRRVFLGAASAAGATLALPRTAFADDGGADSGGDASTDLDAGGDASTVVDAGGAPPRIAIVGAGISGLAAALALTDAGLASKLVIYEASNRIGGRMFSNSPVVAGPAYWDDNQVTEWCGELVDSGHTTIKDLCTRYGLSLDDIVAAEPASSTFVHYFDNAYYTYTQLNADFAAVLPVIQADAMAAIPMMKADGTANDDGTVLWNAVTAAGKALDNMSVYDWIEAKVPGGHSSKLGKLLDVAYASEYGADTKDQSSLNLVLLLAGISGTSFEAFGSSDERFHIRGGNQQLPLAIAKDLQTRLGNAALQMNSRLKKLAKNADGTVALTFDVTDAGQTTTVNVVADAVVLTVPFAVMADVIDFKGAGFDARKTMAIQQLGRGKSSKLQLQFTSRLWNTAGAWGIGNGEETFSDNGNQCSWDPTRGQPGTSGIMNGYTGGTPTLDRAAIAPVAFGKANVGSAGAAIATLATTFLGQLEQVFPGLTPLYNGKATLSIPHLDENFRLSYSFWKVGQYQAFAGYERTPQANIFFGGEHTSVSFQGFMEGGAGEGLRAGREVIDAFVAGTLPKAKGFPDAGPGMEPPRIATQDQGSDSACSCETAGKSVAAGPALVLAAAAAALVIRQRTLRD